MKPFRFLIAGIIILLGLAIAAPALIAALPDRYVYRLPEPLQKYGLPQDQAATLPTAAAPVSAVSLLAATPSIEPHPGTATAEAETSSLTEAIEADMHTRPPLATPDQNAASPTATATPTPTHTPTNTPTPWPLPDQVRLNGFQHQFQTWNNCGPATLAMGLTFFGDQVYQEDTASVLKPDPEDRNVSPQEMAAYVNEQTPHMALYRANGTIQTLRTLLANDIPVIIETGIDPPGEFRWLGWYGHYLLPVAYDDSLEQFWVYDSWFGTSEEPLKNAHPDGRIISYDDLEMDWAQFNRSYIALYRPEQAALLEEIIAHEMDDAQMWQNALERARHDIERDPENPFFWFNLGTNYTALGQYDEAAAAFDQARAIGLPWRMMWYQFGPYETYLNTGRYDDVLLLADTTLEDRPYFEESYYYKGLALERLGDIEGALANLEQAATFNPNFRPAQEALDRLK